MKLLLRLALIGLPLLVATSLFAQKGQQQVGCVEPGLRLQAHELQHAFKEQGFEVMRDAMIHMNDRDPFPIVADLKKGVFYQLIFVGNTRASKLTLQTYNQKEVMIDERHSNTGKFEPNYISFSFTPETSGRYMFVLTQKAKLKSLCGSFTIMELKTSVE